MRASRSNPQSDSERRRMRGLPEDRRRLGALASLSHVRARRLLRRLEEQARDDAFSEGQAPHRPVVRAGRNLALVLHRRGRCLAFGRWRGENRAADQSVGRPSFSRTSRGHPFHSATKVLPMYFKSSTPTLLDQKPEAVRSRNWLKNATPWLCSGLAFLCQAMSSTTWRRSASVQSAKLLAKRSPHSRSSQARPPRIAVWRFSRWRSVARASTIQLSMNSGTSASVALPECSSFGTTMSARMRTVVHSWAVKNLGA